MLSPEVLARIERLNLEARQVVEGYLAGRHRSPRHGFAVEFAQHREYAPGDDIRHIDWKVYGRTERYHLKQYEQETNLISWLIVDASESMSVGTVPRKDGTIITKFDAAATLAASLAYLIAQQADSVGYQIYARKVRGSGRPTGGMNRVRELVRALADGPFDEPADTGHAIRDLAGMLGRRGIVFLFSDLLDDVSTLVEGLKILRSLKHEVVVFQVLDAAEVDFPFRQPTLFHGLESLPEVSTDPMTVRDSYLTALNAHLTEVESVCKSMETDYIRIRTDDDLGLALGSYLQRRVSVR